MYTVQIQMPYELYPNWQQQISTENCGEFERLFFLPWLFSPVLCKIAERVCACAMCVYARTVLRDPCCRPIVYYFPCVFHHYPHFYTVTWQPNQHTNGAYLWMMMLFVSVWLAAIITCTFTWWTKWSVLRIQYILLLCCCWTIVQRHYRRQIKSRKTCWLFPIKWAR